MAADQSWTKLGMLAVNGRISVSDSSYFYEEPVIVDVAKGSYEVDVTFDETGSRVLGMRTRMAGEGQTAVRADLAGKVSVDFAQVALCDRDAGEASFAALGNDGMDVYFDQLQGRGSTFWVNLPGEVLMAVVRCGYGDGIYPVHRLVLPDGRCAGCEVDFREEIED